MVAYASYLPREADIPTSAFGGGGNACSAFSPALRSLPPSACWRLNKALTSTGSRKSARIAELESSSTMGNPPLGPSYPIRDSVCGKPAVRQMSTFGLVFKTYPAILTRMGPIAGTPFGSWFFLSLFVAGISSAISILEAFMSAPDRPSLDGAANAPRPCCVLAFLCGLVFCTQAGLFWLDLVDHFITTYGLVIVGISEALIVGWLLPVSRLRTHLDQHHVFRFGKTLLAAMRLLITRFSC